MQRKLLKCRRSSQIRFRFISCGEVNRPRRRRRARPPRRRNRRQRRPLLQLQFRLRRQRRCQRQSARQFLKQRRKLRQRRKYRLLSKVHRRHSIDLEGGLARSRVRFLGSTACQAVAVGCQQTAFLRDHDPGFPARFAASRRELQAGSPRRLLPRRRRVPPSQFALAPGG
jgi:hypothetical protein